ncbi:hypothetical protein BT93_L2279 [Corymbia citriodora subsp. variegata]|uniref:NADH-ubiquinone oxidoreductase chain 4 n=1 Tax=Corymbia citriodora subsp. variegata TaxID=360336 RepID=A0A8T0CPX2_CORYI|nr:hypothetical protein BT93_L2279 [Corymbia citriodora subsp. variegata]
MLLMLLLLIPVSGIFLISTSMHEDDSSNSVLVTKQIKITGLITSIVNLFVSLIVFIFFNFSSNQFQFVQEYHKVSSFDFYLETLLLAVFLVLDVLLFYIFFESILPPLFILIGLFGSSNRVRASFYLFLYTLLGGSIILAAIVLKLSLYGILRIILPLLPKAYLYFTFVVYAIGVITIIYASFSTLRTIDVKELIAYSSVSHAAVYLLGVFSNSVQGIEGGIALGLGHGFVSSGLFICAGGVLYDRSHTRLITYYRGITQLMPLFSIVFFILCLGNCGAPLTLNFVGEFMSLYGVFEKLPILGVFASSSIIFSAAYTIYMFNRIAFAGAYSKFFLVNIPDLNKREFLILLTLVVFTVVLGIYPAPVLDGLHYSVSGLLYYSPIV